MLDRTSSRSEGQANRGAGLAACLQSPTMADTRELWKRIETLHAVTYFAPESSEAAREAGLRGFWMGYFGFRASPLGPVSAPVVEAAFANFAPAMVRRSVPDAWSFADPSDLVTVRARAAADALRRLAPGIEAVAVQVNDRLEAVAATATSIGRPLFAANRDVAPLDDPVEQLWQHCTTLREHRGDGHVAALAVADVDGCQAHQLLIAAQGLPAEVLRDNRGWTEEQWEAAALDLHHRGLVSDDELTDEGRELHHTIEERTDSLAGAPFEAAASEAVSEAVSADASGSLVDDLTDALTAVAVGVASSGVLPFPNPMGLPSVAAPD